MGCVLALDSGSTYMSVPSLMLNVLKTKKFPVSGDANNGFWDCTDDPVRYGNITVVIGKDKYNIEPQDWQYPSSFKEVNQTKREICHSTIMQVDTGNLELIIGERFMRQFYTVYDRDQDRIGLAEAVTVK